MADDVFIADPLGHKILMKKNICDGILNNQLSIIYDDVATVLEKPAMLLEVFNNGIPQRYYFRSIGWNITILIAVKPMENDWEAFLCIQNPSGTELTTLMKNAKQLI